MERGSVQKRIGVALLLIGIGAIVFLTRQAAPPNDNGNTHAAPGILDAATESEPSTVKTDRADNTIHEAEISLPLNAEYDIEPLRLVERYRVRAVDGDPNSELILADMFAYCRGAPRTEADLENLRNSGIPEAYILSATRRFTRCRALLAEIPNVDEQADKWLSAATESGHPLLALRRAHQSLENKRAQIKYLLAQEWEEPFLLGEVLLHAGTLYSLYPENRNMALEHAWVLLACRYRYQCDVADYIAGMEKNLHSYQIDEILTTTDELHRALNDGDTKALGF